MGSQLYDASTLYIQKHLPIIPVCSADHSGMSAKHKERCKTPGKAPLITEWSQRVSTTQEELEDWHRTWPMMNIGLSLGDTEDLGILIGIDIDGAEGLRMWEQITANREVPDTWQFTTGGGGVRYLYKISAKIRTKKNKVFWSDGHEEVAFLVQGQQTVLPPSIHASGNLYRWVAGRSPMNIDIAEAPMWMQTIVKEDKVIETHEETFTQEDAEGINDEGERSNELARMTGHMCRTSKLPFDSLLMFMHAHNHTHNRPPLPDEEVEKMVSSIWNSEQRKQKKETQAKERRENLTQAKLCYGFLYSRREAGIYYLYDPLRKIFYYTSLSTPGWTPCDMEEMEPAVFGFLNAIDGKLATAGKVTSMVKCLRNYCMDYNTQEAQGDDEGYDYIMRTQNSMDSIVTLDGVLDWKTGELRSWDPVIDRHTVRITARWTPYNEAEEETMVEAKKIWETALEAWIPEKDTIKYLQEYIGYALTPMTKHRAFTLLYGGGANGKSLFIDIIKYLFEETAHTTTLDQIAERFDTAYLDNKLLVECSDLDSTYLEKTGVIKQIVSGDQIRGEYKGGSIFRFTPICKLLFSANTLPKTGDKTTGWYSRIKVVKFPHQFTPNPKFYHLLTSTMSSQAGRMALLHWAVEGLQRLEENGEFTIGADMARSAREYVTTNDAVQEFSDQYLRPAAIKTGTYKTAILFNALYDVYTNWCEDTGTKVMSKRIFKKSIETNFEIKNMRFKQLNGSWKTSAAVVDASFAEDSDDEAQAIYTNSLRSQQIQANVISQ